MKYEILEHVTDLKIRSFGRTKEELFLNAMSGMYEGAKYEVQDGKIEREMKVSSPDLASLLVDFLSELLYLTEINREVYEQIQFKKFDDPSTLRQAQGRPEFDRRATSSGQVKLEGILIGKKLKRMGVLIKGVTYHDLEIHQRKDKTWEATVLFDI